MLLESVPRPASGGLCASRSSPREKRRSRVRPRSGRAFSNGAVAAVEQGSRFQLQFRSAVSEEQSHTASGQACAAGMAWPARCNAATGARAAQCGEPYTAYSEGPSKKSTKARDAWPTKARFTGTVKRAKAATRSWRSRGAAQSERNAWNDAITEQIMGLRIARRAMSNGWPVKAFRCRYAVRRWREQGATAALLRSSR